MKVVNWLRAHFRDVVACMDLYVTMSLRFFEWYVLFAGIAVLYIFDGNYQTVAEGIKYVLGGGIQVLVIVTYIFYQGSVLLTNLALGRVLIRRLVCFIILSMWVVFCKPFDSNLMINCVTVLAGLKLFLYVLLHFTDLNGFDKLRDNAMPGKAMKSSCELEKKEDSKEQRNGLE